MIQEKKKYKKSKKKPSAMAQVHNRVNAGVMDGVVYGGMMESAEPEDEEYEIGTNEPGPSNYFHVKEGKKTMFITESQANQMRLLLENEGTNLKKARNFLRDRGYDEERRQKVLDAIRHDIPNSRLRECKFILGVVRLYLDGQLRNGDSIGELNKILKYIAMDAHVNEYDNNLNGLGIDELIKRFSGIAADDLKQSMERSNARKLNANKNYRIVPIDSAEEASKYADYVTWCVTQDEDAYDSYTNGGSGRFYFCLRNDFKALPETPGDGCPLDSYGLSMIAVSVREDGSVNTITCRWNHENGGNDNIMTPEQLEDIIGLNFYQTFKPYTREQLRAKGIIPFDEIPGLLAMGKRPEELFKTYEKFTSTDVYLIESGGRFNFVRPVNNDGKKIYQLIYDTWFEKAYNTEDEGTGFECALVKKCDGQWNFVLPNGELMSKTWFKHANTFENGYAEVVQNIGGVDYLNFIDTSGNLKLDKALKAGTSEAAGSMFVDYQLGIRKNGIVGLEMYTGEKDKWNMPITKNNLLSIEGGGKLIFDEWCDWIHETPDWFFWNGERATGYIAQITDEQGTKTKKILLPDGTPMVGPDFQFGECVIYAHSLLIFYEKPEPSNPYKVLAERFKTKATVLSVFSRKLSGPYESVNDGSYLNAKEFLPLKVQNGGKINYMDKNGEPISEIDFDGGNIFIQPTQSNYDEFVVARVTLNGKNNFLTPEGRLVSPKWFDEFGIWLPEDFWVKGEFADMYRVLVRIDGKWYKLYENGKLVEFDSHGGMNSYDYNTIHGNLLETVDRKMIVEDSQKKVDYDKYIKSLVDFMREQHLRIDPLPEIELNPEEQDGIFVKTGYYSPDEKKVVVFTDGRHPKDVLRTVAHEFIHHMQNLQNPDKDWGTGGDLEADGKLRGIEGEAFLLGNIIFREWTEKMKKTRELNESRMSESPDSIDCNGFNLRYWDEDAIPFLFLKDGNEFYVGKPGETHMELLDEVGVGREDIMKFSSNRREITDLKRTGRYWKNANIISFWLTPNETFICDAISRLLNKLDIPVGSLLVDMWETRRIVPFRWLNNGTYDMLKELGLKSVYPIESRTSTPNSREFMAEFKDGQTKKLNIKGDFIDEMDFSSYYPMYESVETELVEPDDVDLSSFNIKKHLNPKFWDGEHLDTRIRLKLLDIADDFFNSLDVDWVEPEDVIITGSLANYNWDKKYSDIDLHILVDYEDVDERVDFVREYFTMKKNEWNQKHKNLKIFGFPVEVYVQDSSEPHASSGVYSIDKDKWLTEPDLEKLRSGKVDKRHVREMVSTYMNKIDCLIDIYKKHKDDEYEMKKVSKDASEIFDEIKSLRKDDLAKYGREMCDGNLIFKALRRSDYIAKLIKLKNLTYDKINSL